MNSSDNMDQLSDDGWDNQYFDLIAELAETNSSRYEMQAKQLVSEKVFTVSVNGVEVKYELSPTGCWFYTSDKTGRYQEDSWIRMGWKKSSKILALPAFFAKSEAGVLLEQSH